jgi:choline dehydrogenase-like flavoprotein/SAM-dependent methyltransferase
MRGFGSCVFFSPTAAALRFTIFSSSPPFSLSQPMRLVLLLLAISLAWASGAAGLTRLDETLYACHNDHSRAHPPTSMPLPLLAALAPRASECNETMSLEEQCRTLLSGQPDDLVFHARQWYLAGEPGDSSSEEEEEEEDRDAVWSRCHLEPPPPSTQDHQVPRLVCDQQAATGFHVVIGTGPAGSVVTHELARTLPASAVLLVLEAGPAPRALHDATIDTRSHSDYMEAGNRRLTRDNSIFVRNARVLGGGSTVNLDLAFAPTLPQLQARIQKWQRAGWIDPSLTPECIQHASEWVEAQLGTCAINLTHSLNRNNALLWHGAAHASSQVDASSYRLNAQPPPSSGLQEQQQWTKRSAVHAFLVPALRNTSGEFSVAPLVLARARVIELVRKRRAIETIFIELGLPAGQHGPVQHIAIDRPVVVILSAGALGSAQVLLQSHARSNHLYNPHVGRGVVLHPSLPLLAKFPFAIDAHQGLSTSVYATPRNGSDTSFLLESMSADVAYVQRLFPLDASQAADLTHNLRHYGGFGVMVIDTSNATYNRLEWDPIAEAAHLYYRLTAHDASAMRRAVAIAMRILFQQGATQVLLPTVELAPLTRADQIDVAMARWKLAPFQTSLTSAHMQATNKAGLVIDRQFRFLVYDTANKPPRPIRNLFIVDGSVFPESIGANPMQSIYVMAKLFATHVTLPTQQSELLRMIVRSDLAPHAIEHGNGSGVQDFLDHVLRQVEAKPLAAVLGRALYADDPYAAAQAEFQQRLRPWHFPLVQVRAMQRQNNLLGDQITALWNRLSRTRRIDPRLAPAEAACLEIGFPGRHITAHLLPPYATHWARGQRWVMWETASDTTKGEWTFGERIQAWSWHLGDAGKNFDRQVAWNNYAPVPEDVIATRSLDVIVILIGLHHVPVARLEPFAHSLFRMLREGGRLIIREHDASTPERLFQAHAAHTLFNLVASGVSSVEDRNEFRNFQSLEAWIALLAGAGFCYDAVPALQYKDPTINTLCSFEKPFDPSSPPLLPQPQAPSKEDVRAFTVAEWYSVQLAQYYASFIHHTPWYLFPYMTTARTMWSLAWAALDASTSRDPSYMLMNAWICATTTLQHTAMAALALPFRLVYSAETEAAAAALDTVAVQVRASPAVLAMCAPTHNGGLVQLPRYTAFFAPFRALCACLGKEDGTFAVESIRGFDTVLVQFVAPTATLAMPDPIHAWVSPFDPTAHHSITRVAVHHLPALLHLSAPARLIKIYES